MGMEEPGDENTNELTRFRFWCPDTECKANDYFHANWEMPPVMVPSGMPCPYECGEYAEFVIDIDSTPVVQVRGNFDDGSHNPHYTTVRAEAEHKWMGYQIEEAKRAVDGDDQITGKAASPYGKRTLNVDNALEQGVIKKVSDKEASARKRMIDDRAKLVADKAKDQLTPIEQKHVGRRHDG